MKSKIKHIVLPILLLTAVLLSACSKAEDTGTDNAVSAERTLSETEQSKTEDTEINTVAFSEHSDAENTEFYDEIGSITGYYMRSNTDYIIFENSYTSLRPESHIETYYEPVSIRFADGEEGEVSMDSLKTGDKIEVDIGLITASYPGQARIYGLRLVEEGDVSNIADKALLDLEDCGIHAVIGEKTEQPPVTRHSGYFVRTETGCFLVPAEKYGLLSGIDILNIHPASDAESAGFDVSGVSLDGFKTGDRIWIDVMLVQELYPPISPIYGAALIEAGDISDIDPSVISKLEGLGYTVV
ncbi:MAG: hypothetical protein K2J72_11820 [Oscillospiraceae bacterium]|nr:hypothetical protein [Oscillospiraceae bacterium]